MLTERAWRTRLAVQAFPVTKTCKACLTLYMAKTQNADTLGVHLPNEVIAEITERGDAIGQKKGKYGALIIMKWYAEGCPPVNDVDRAMTILRGKRGPKPPK